MNCLLCLNINESGKKSFNSDEWKELNIQYIVEKYLWKMENLSNHSYICQECWQELHNFHNFYLKIEKAHLNLNILVKSEVASEDVSSNKEDLGAQFFIDNENHKIQPEILFVNIESPLKIVEVGEVICSKRTNDKKTIPKNYTKKIFKKEKDTTAINKPEYKEDSAKHNCIDSKENFQIEREILFIKEESPLEIFEKEDVEEVSCLKNTTKRKRHLMKNTNDKKNICKNNPKKIFRREDTTVINKPECKGGPAEQICIEHKENSQIEPEILLLEEDNPLEMFEKECMGEVSSLKNTTKRKRPLRKSANNKKNIAKKKQKKRLKKEKVTKSEDNKNHDEEIDIKLKEVEYDPKSNKIDEHLNDQKDIFVSDVDHSSNSIDSSKLEQSNQEQDKFISKHFQIACSLCDIPLATFDIMAKHYKEQHSQHGYATCCDQKLFSRLEIVNHIKIHQNAEYFKCKICDKVTVTRSCLRQHIKDNHKKKNVECDICGKSLANASSLRTHKLMHEAAVG